MCRPADRASVGEDAKTLSPDISDSERGFLPDKLTLVPRQMAVCSNSVHGSSSTLREDKAGSVTMSGGRFFDPHSLELATEFILLPFPFIHCSFLLCLYLVLRLIESRYGCVPGT